MPTQHEKEITIGVIGGGWFGSHIALQLKKAGFRTSIREKNNDIFTETSGDFGGGRVHSGPHYPRSAETRKNCRQTLEEFLKTYGELVVESDSSIYGLGYTDAESRPPKVSKDDFKKVCEESPVCKEIDPAASGYQNLQNAFNIPIEPSIAIGRLRETFKNYLKAENVDVKCNCNVKKIEKVNDKFVLTYEDGSSEKFDRIVNATGYQALSLQPAQLPFEDMEVVYQPCLGLIYQDTQITERPMSFTVMDGMFPCLAPYNKYGQDEDTFHKKYLLTHCKWTIMGTSPTPEKAREILKKVDDNLVETQIKPHSEQEMNRFWPEFSRRFKYLGWKGTVLAKLKTNRDFRSAVTFESDGIIHVFPGKVSNAFNAEREVLALVNNQNIIKKGAFRYVQDGVLYNAVHEVTEKPVLRNTYNLQTYDDLKRSEKLNKVKPTKGTPFWKKQNDNPDKSKLSNFDNGGLKIIMHKTNKFVSSNNKNNMLFSFWNYGCEVNLNGAPVSQDTIKKIIAQLPTARVVSTIKNLYELSTNGVIEILKPNSEIDVSTNELNQLVIPEAPEKQDNLLIEEKLLAICNEIFKDRKITPTDNLKEICDETYQTINLLTKVNTEFLDDSDIKLQLTDLDNDFNIQSLSALIAQRLEINENNASEIDQEVAPNFPSCALSENSGSLYQTFRR